MEHSDAGATSLLVDQFPQYTTMPPALAFTGDGNQPHDTPARSELVETGGEDRLFVELPLKGDIPALAAEEKLQREISFDPDLWVVEVEDRAGRHFLNVVEV